MKVENIRIMLKIVNRMYAKQIRKLRKNIIKSKCIDESKNTLCLAGELIIENLRLWENGKTIIALPVLRNIYESTLKGLVFEDSKEIRDSYNKIEKEKEKDGMRNVRKFIGDNYNKYFNIIENDPIIKEHFNKGILTYIHDNLCKYAHCTKVNEIVYLVQKEKQLKEMFDVYILLFLVYPIILMYIDGVCNKLNLGNIAEENSITYATILLNFLLLLLNYREIIQEMNEFFKGTADFSDKLIIDKVKNEQEFARYCIEQIKEEVAEEDFNAIDFADVEKILKKCFGIKEFEKYNMIFIKELNKDK